jgi:phosphoglycerate dehydrogenase and related dehydrogenases
MKCLITDAVYPGIAEELKKFMDIKTSDGKPLSKEEMIREIVDADVLIMRVDPKIDRDVLDAAKNLKAIGVCAVGLNHVDLEYAKEKGIQVFNAPGLNANAVAELTISKMLDISRHTIPANQDVKVSHIWDKYKLCRQRAARQDPRCDGLRSHRPPCRRARKGFRHGHCRLRSLPEARGF